MFNQEDIANIMEEQLKSDEISEYVNEKVKKTIKSAIDDQFSSFGRLSGESKNIGYIKINEMIQSSVGLNLEKIKIPEFQALFIESINKSLNEIAIKDLDDMVQKNMKNLLVADKETVTLQEIVYEFMYDQGTLEEYRDEINSYGDGYVDELSVDDICLSDIVGNFDILGLHLEKSSNGYAEICFQKEGSEDYNFQYDNHLRVKKIDGKDDLYEVWAFASENIGNEKTNILFNEFSSFERLLFQITRGAVKIKITQEEIDSLFVRK